MAHLYNVNNLKIDKIFLKNLKYLIYNNNNIMAMVIYTIV